MASAPKSEAPRHAAVDAMFSNLFARETGVLCSPVFAIELGGRLRDSGQAEEFWGRAELEFYDGPYFRMHHAYHLIRTGKVRHAFAKLAALVQEMPWLREASINLLRLFEHLDPAGDKLVPDLRERVRETVRKNGWTPEGMHVMDIPLGA